MFENRIEAGFLLSQNLSPVSSPLGLILGVTRGGVVVAAEVARRLRLPLDIVVVKKLGVPGEPELAFGAVAPDGIFWVDRDMVRERHLNEASVAHMIGTLGREAARAMRRYRHGMTFADMPGRDVSLVDDGAATGATLTAAVLWVRKQRPASVSLGIPVASKDAATALHQCSDRAVILDVPDDFRAVGQFYRSFPQVQDQDVIALVKQYHAPAAAG
ncbi:phosphoribosyltransferase [Patescibacteria group bacterium]|nr:phosphoribosyltransferase [Patescibacteria group bacterium]